MDKFEVYLDAPESGGGRRLPLTVERPLRPDLETAGFSSTSASSYSSTRHRSTQGCTSST